MQIDAEVCRAAKALNQRGCARLSSHAVGLALAKIVKAFWRDD